MNKKCCDPFKCHKKQTDTGLRDVSQLKRQLYPSLQFKTGDKICTLCRKKLSTIPTENNTAASAVSSAANQSIEPEIDELPLMTSNNPDEFISPEHELSQLNKSLVLLGESPVVKNKLTSRVNYFKRKSESADKAVKRKLHLVSESTLSDSMLSEVTQSDDESEMIKQLKEKFSNITKRSEKIQILTVLPKSWSIRKIESEFNVSNYMARKTKKIVKEKGILSMPNPKSGKVLSKTTVDTVKLFYNDEKISRSMSGKKDYVSVSINGNREQIQKRLVLCNLKEAYQQFKEEYPDCRIGFSSFANLRPPECILAGSSGTHSVCVCTVHQNAKLMFHGAKLDKISSNYTYQHCLAEMHCNPPTIHCVLGVCDQCPNKAELKHKLEIYFDEQMIDEVEFKQWTTTDRSTLETTVCSVDEFIQIFSDILPKVYQHDFIAKQQAMFLQEAKDLLKPGEFLVIGDFAENYSFVVQDAAQSFHWNNLQATLHPFVIYYRMPFAEDEADAPLKHVSFVVISECNTHDTIAVHLFQKALINFLLTEIGKPKKILYFSDGCAAQYKNRKNFINLCYHERDFGMPAEWHFFATSHGKGPCDGIGGTVKRLATRASLQRPYDQQILTPLQLFQFAKSSIANINVVYSTIDDYNQESDMLRKRFENARTITGTHKLHSVRSISQDYIEVKHFSAQIDKRVEPIVLSPCQIIKAEDIRGFVTIKYDNNWWLGCVLNTNHDSNEAEVTFLHPKGPSTSFRYPNQPDILTISYQDVLGVVNPVTATGRTYSLTSCEMAHANNILAKLMTNISSDQLTIDL